jgi:peptidoglycan pentaglycine glycine transferase (the first glycine)
MASREGKDHAACQPGDCQVVRPAPPTPGMIYNPLVSSNETLKAWERFIAARPEAHLLQTSQWGALKAAFGWQVHHTICEAAGAQSLSLRLAPGLKFAYVPKGPAGDWLPDLLPALAQAAREAGAFMLKLEPDMDWVPDMAEALQTHGFLPSPQTIQPRRTIVVDLSPSEDEILACMKQKTRYNIRLADRKGVSVRPWDDIPAFAAMTLETAERDGFGAHSEAYFQRAYDLFSPLGACRLLVAEVDSDPVAAIMVFRRGARAWYFYGASTDRHREKMPAYLLQWEGMRWAKSHGCTSYDLWGIPDADEETLEAHFTERNDGLWGVYRFKRGFGGMVTRTMGAWDLPLIPALYRPYRWLMARRSGD